MWAHQRASPFGVRIKAGKSIRHDRNEAPAGSPCAPLVGRSRLLTLLGPLGGLLRLVPFDVSECVRTGSGRSTAGKGKQDDTENTGVMPSLRPKPAKFEPTQAQRTERNA